MNHRLSWTIHATLPGAYHWSVQAIDAGFAGSAFASEEVVVPVDVSAPAEAPRALELHAAAPSPFTRVTEIRFDLPQPATVGLRLYDVGGRLVRTLIANGAFPAGWHRAYWDGTADDGRSAAAGVYFCEMRSSANVRVSRIVLVR
jgi:hypothetical protein